MIPKISRLDIFLHTSCAWGDAYSCDLRESRSVTRMYRMRCRDQLDWDGGWESQENLFGAGTRVLIFGMLDAK